MSDNATVDFIEVLIKRYIDKQYPDNAGYEVKTGLISDTMDTTLFKVLVSLQDSSKEVNVKASDVCFRENIELDQIEEELTTPYVNAICRMNGLALTLGVKKYE